MYSLPRWRLYGDNTHLYAYIPISVSLKRQAHTSFKKQVGYSISFNHHIMKLGELTFMNWFSKEVIEQKR